MAMRLGRNMWCYANKFSPPAKTLCAVPVGARSYSSGSLAYPASSVGGFLTVGTFLGWLSYRLDWGSVRTKDESFMSVNHRSKFESAQAELEMIERKINAVKAKQYERNCKDNVVP